MKSCNFFFRVIGACLLSYVLLSCSEKEETLPVPSVADNGSTTSVNVGDTIILRALVVAQAKLKSIEVRRNNVTIDTKTSFTNPESDNFVYRTRATQVPTPAKQLFLPS